MHFQAYGVVVRSDQLALPRLEAAPPGAAPHGTIRLGALGAMPAWRERDSGRSVRSGVLSSAPVIGYGGVATVVFRPAELLVEPADGATTERLGHVVVADALPRWLESRGELVLHASSVTTRDGAVVFLGPSGVGKSSLAVALARAPHGRLLADDVVVVRERNGVPWAVPSYPAARLHEDSALMLLRRSDLPPVVPGVTKRSAEPDAGLPFADAPARVRRVFVLEPAAPDVVARVEPLSARDAVVHLAKHTVRLPDGSTDRLAAALAREGRLARAGLVARLVVPRSFERLPEVVSLVLEELERPTRGAAA